MVAESDTARLFFAAWPPPEAQRALGDLAGRLQDECGGRALPAGNIHLTLVFLGEVSRGRLPQLEDLAAAVKMPHFEIHLDQTGYWRHNRIVWAGVGRGAAELVSLAAELERALAGEGLRLEKRTFFPHATLLRNARRAPAVASMRPVAWPATGYTLVESVPLERARHYRVRRTWPLG